MPVSYPGSTPFEDTKSRDSISTFCDSTVQETLLDSVSPPAPRTEPIVLQVYTMEMRLFVVVMVAAAGKIVFYLSMYSTK